VAGTGAAAEGADELTAGTRELRDGARQLATGADQLADEAIALPENLRDAVEIADRGVVEAAVTDALLRDGVGLAREEVGPDAFRTVTLVAAGSTPLPWVPLGLVVAGLLAGAALVGGVRSWRTRRTGGASTHQPDTAPVAS